MALRFVAISVELAEQCSHLVLLSSLVTFEFCLLGARIAWYVVLDGIGVHGAPRTSTIGMD